MLFETHILARGYFHTKKWNACGQNCGSHKADTNQMDKQTDGQRQTERQTDGQTEERRTDRRKDKVNHSIPQNTSINPTYIYLNVSVWYRHMRLNKMYILSHVQHMLQTLRPIDMILSTGRWLYRWDILSISGENMKNMVLSNCRRDWDSFGRIKTPITEYGTIGKTGCLNVEKTHVS